MFGLFKKSDLDNDLEAEHLRESSRLLFRKIARFNGDTDIDYFNDRKQVLYISSFVMVWFIRWSYYERYRTQEVDLSPSEWGASFVILDRVYQNLAVRYAFTNQDLTNLWDPVFAKYISLIMKSDLTKENTGTIMETKRESLSRAIKFLKDSDRLTPDFTIKLDNLVQDMMLNVLDIFVLSEKEDMTESFRPLCKIWITLSDNFEELTYAY